MKYGLAKKKRHVLVEQQKIAKGVLMPERRFEVIAFGNCVDFEFKDFEVRLGGYLSLDQLVDLIENWDGDVTVNKVKQ